MEATEPARQTARTVELLWGPGADRERPGLSTAAIVSAAVALADAEGLGALSMRRIAERLGFTAMSLYRHVPGKAELIDLMRDAVVGELDLAEPADGGWRGALEAWARAHWALHLRHPWLVHSDGSRRVPGPNIVADFDRALAFAERTGLPSAAVVAVVGLVAGFVGGAARQVEEVVRLERESGVSYEQWWRGQGDLFARMESFPAIGRHWRSGGFDAPEDPFDFGLARTLDGVELLVLRHREESAGDGIRYGKRDVKTTPPVAHSCALCGDPLPPATRGRPQRYCSQACRQRAYRRRHPSGSG
ncbi:TetR/AcrR family transcriptional regulator [Streptantibioticus cattleyicolor]|uniref:Putative transcriptional regulator, TetR family n=1 Tax=Streptantibioticus cattleyicolor (strain ATCC 35852 / DSM 46488 / JCM 4925 / NBRC 14057 / NRRL 8057) TaxID=1003195 RepID=F8JN59_STREN|nr:TetR/AcrR family transcriptional regulator [Streptantibioticus cattleyicolor]AEW99190.1 putative transcriptional regulator, TetR family [Streptantibioticus cattleyicolor NRRL 8057 = DSM 46488]CCB71767.1 Transcriptional regulator, tetR family [Streptantibioticus cattleyicolor NRRL 8057 = DSM 46488]